MCSFFCRTLLQLMRSRISTALIATDRKRNVCWRKKKGVRILLALVYKILRLEFSIYLSIFPSSSVMRVLVRLGKFMNISTSIIQFTVFAYATQLIAATWYSNANKQHQFKSTQRKLWRFSLKMLTIQTARTHFCRKVGLNDANTQRIARIKFNHV